MMAPIHPRWKPFHDCILCFIGFPAAIGLTAVYLSLIACAIWLGSGSRATYILGWTHGLLWIGMSLVCIAAARARASLETAS